jgi:hypothetical protein
MADVSGSDVWQIVGIVIQINGDREVATAAPPIWISRNLPSLLAVLWAPINQSPLSFPFGRS